MTAQNKRKLDNLKNAQIWYARLGHISQDRIKRLVDSKSLEIDNLDNLPVYVCGPLNTQARGGFSYFITFTNDLHDRGVEYLSGEFLDYLKENGIVCQWTPSGTPQLNGVAERRHWTLLDMVQSMMSVTEMPLSFWGYALETAARLLNIAPSKAVAQTPYQIWHGKPASYKYLRVWDSPAYVKRLVGDKLDSRSSLSRNAVFLERGLLADTQRNELLLEESSEAPQFNAGTSSAPVAPTDNVPILRRSARVPEPLERYGFLGVTGQLDNDPKTYGEAMSNIDSEKWLEAIKFEMDSMSSNQVWILVDRPKDNKPIGCKWVYKRKIGADGEVTTFKARLVAK
ncbi:UNVERIFIED_CONTAM: hypothetical protein Slati_3764800 [Sesamum latifolium]|uniref:Integrase catalytic domain-containing protein n=1 Tax=Sesamum latifolium TaxID=2727402 RepID=A0AAW2U7Q6_9LAMI